MKKLYYDPPKHRWSAVIVKPKQEFLAWYNDLAKKRTVFRYVPEDDLLLMIPDIGLLDTSERMNEFLEDLKPDIARRNFLRFSRSEEEWPGPATAQTCDRFFELEIRDTPINGLTEGLRAKYFSDAT
jgi:hypothetical protein